MDVWTEDGCRLWTAVTGQGKPLVMCHGGPGLWDMAGSLGSLLAGSFRVIRWDQRGCGRSEHRGPYSVARCVADLDAVQAQASGQKAALSGHSWGATLALRYALDHQRTWHEDELIGECRRLEVPVLIIDGELDLRPRRAVDSLARALPDVRRVVLPDAGHIPWLERPGELAGHLLRFLSQ